VALSGPHTHAYVAALITTLVSLAADDGDLLAVARRWPPGRRVDLFADQADSLPDPPERFNDGLPSAIWA
jgi:hypothetical protein